MNAIHYVRKIMSTNTMKQFVEMIEVSLGIEGRDLIAFIKNNLQPTNQFLDTCSIGLNAENSVVNNQFKVHGINNLRIVHASIFLVNFILKADPVLTIYALAEKASVIYYVKHIHNEL
jgi:choline dehydrogenase-like flavoprotein